MKKPTFIRVWKIDFEDIFSVQERAFCTEKSANRQFSYVYF